MLPWSLWYLIRPQFSCQYLCSILYPLALIIPLYISLHLLCYPWPPIISSDQFYHLPLLPCTAISVSWCSQIISILNFSFFGTYTLSSFSTSPSSTCHSQHLNSRFLHFFYCLYHFLILISCLLYLLYYFLPYPSTNCSIALTSNHFSFNIT